MEPTTDPQHFLLLVRDHAQDAIIVNLAKRSDITPLYSISHNSKMTKMEIRRLKCDAVSTEHRPVGAVKLRTIPPRIDLTVRGVAFKMARKHPLSSALGFRFLGAGEMRWEVNKKGGGMRLVDFNGKIQAHFRPRMHVVGQGHNAAAAAGGGGGGGEGEDEKSGRSSPGHKTGWGPGFELHATKLADLDLDLIVTTGLAAAEHRRQLDDDWDQAAGEDMDKARGGS